MPGKYKISVVIPNYNRGELLIRAVESALAQSYPVHEIIVCDDGSSDDSRQRIFELNNSKVIWLDCGRNGRPAIPRNMGIEKSSGNFVAFLDNDDEWTTNKIEKQVQLIESSEVDIICSNASKISGGKDFGAYSSLRLPQVLNYFNLVASNSVICSSVLIKKELLEKYGLFPVEPELKALEDYFLWLKISCGNAVYYSPELLVKYNDESGQSIRKDSLSTREQLFVIFTHFKKWADANGHLCPTYLVEVMREVFVMRFMNKRERFFYKLFNA